jgi:hypothetical protein
MRSTVERTFVASLAVAFWIALGAIAAFGWYATARGLALSWGLRDAASGLGVLAAVAVLITMWRWARSEHEASALADGACPRCSAEVAQTHEHSRPGAPVPGITSWRCEACGYERTRQLTCASCAA